MPKQSGILNCRICGYEAESPPWGVDEESPLFEFCPCCGVEHGYQDATREGALRFRNGWLSGGAQWDDSSMRPEDWDLQEQLKHIPVPFQ